ncbi:MAG: ribonuclease HI [Spirochaetaceae bacterium]|jgi:ribonuclease HI|nr:ribonuclease HI [Spirochaetaceae bacterium]
MGNFYDNFNIIAYADGACKNNGAKDSKGGWAFVIWFDGNKKEIHSAGYSEMTTNQRMELTAVIKVLEEIKIRWPDSGVPVIILSDSQYVVKGASDWMFNWERKGWKRSNNPNSKSGVVSNLDLWKKMFSLVKEIHPVFSWIKGHAGYKYNELCDDLAGAAIDTQSDYYKVFKMPLGLIN